MKYFVSKITKEHIPVSRAGPWVREGDDWRIVEADSEGWIPWSGGECPLPDDHRYDIKSARYGRPTLGFDKPQIYYWRQDGDIAAYRPVLSETAEKEVKCEMPPASVFDRLKSAVAASESIPTLLAEIESLLPPQYRIALREVNLVEQPAEDMSDWRNWKEGDLLECIRPTGFHTKGRLYLIGTGREGYYGILDDDGDGILDDGWREYGDVLDRYAPGGECFNGEYFRFHSRLGKERV